MTEFFTFIWSVIETIATTIYDLISFLKNIITMIPQFVSYFPTEIASVLVAIFTLSTVMIIYKFIK